MEIQNISLPNITDVLLWILLVQNKFEESYYPECLTFKKKSS